MRYKVLLLRAIDRQINRANLIYDNKSEDKDERRGCMSGSKCFDA